VGRTVKLQGPQHFSPSVSRSQLAGNFSCFFFSSQLERSREEVLRRGAGRGRVGDESREGKGGGGGRWEAKWEGEGEGDM
jgi:hypothetical protein